MNRTSWLATIGNASRVRFIQFLLGGFSVASVFLGVGLLIAWVDSTTEPLIDVDVGSLDLGDQWATVDFRWSLRIRNISNGEVTLHKIVTSCGCVQMTNEAIVLPADATRELELKLDLTKGPADGSAQTWPFDADLTPFVSASGEPSKTRLGGGPWRLRGTVRKLFQISPALVDCSEGFVRGQPLPERAVDVTCLHPITSLTAAVDPPLADVILERVARAGEGGRFLLRARVHDSVPVGEFAAAVQLKAMLVGGIEAVPFEIPVRGRVFPEVYSVPGSVGLPATRVGQVVERVLQFQSRGDKAFDIFFGRSNDKNLSVVGLEKNDSEVHCRVRVSVAGEGDHQGELLFSVRVEGKNVSELRVPARWYGIADERGATMVSE